MKSSPEELGVIMRPGMYIRRSVKKPVSEAESEADGGVETKNSIKTNMKIGIKGLEIAAFIGVYHFEKGKAQPLFLDIEIELQAADIVKNDDIATTIDYDDLANAAAQLAHSGHFNLIETYVEKLAQIILKDVRIKNVAIIAQKPQAIKNAQSAVVAIDCARS